MEAQPLMAHIIVGATQAAGEFRVIVPAQHVDFESGPAPGWGGQAEAPPFTLGDDRLDGAPGAAGKDGVRDLAQLGDFVARPRLWFSFRHGRPCLEYSQKRRPGSSRLSARNGMPCAKFTSFGGRRLRL